MRILFTRFPLESAYGGAEVQTMTLMEGLRARGHDVSFLGSCPVLLQLVAAAGFETIPLEIGPPPVRADLALTFAWRQGAMRTALLAALRKLPQPDVVCMLSLTEKLLLTNPLSAQGTRIVWIEHDRLGRWLRWNPWLPRLRRLAKRAVTVCVSTLSRNLYLALGWPSEMTVTIANGIETGRFATLPLPPARTQPLQIACIARLTRDKGVDLLVDAVSGLPDVALSVVGTGRDEDIVRDHAAAARARGSDIVFISPPVDTPEFLSHQDALVLPSRDHDPFGLVVAEAMAAGRAVIVTECCGIAGELRDGVDAFIVSADDHLALRAAIIRLRDDDALRLRMSENARETALARFDAAAMIDAYERVF